MCSKDRFIKKAQGETMKSNKLKLISRVLDDKIVVNLQSIIIQNNCEKDII